MRKSNSCECSISVEERTKTEKMVPKQGFVGGLLYTSRLDCQSLLRGPGSRPQHIVCSHSIVCLMSWIFPTTSCDDTTRNLLFLGTTALPEAHEDEGFSSCKEAPSTGRLFGTKLLMLSRGRVPSRIALHDSGDVCCPDTGLYLGGAAPVASQSPMSATVRPVLAISFRYVSPLHFQSRHPPQ